MSGGGCLESATEPILRLSGSEKRLGMSILTSNPILEASQLEAKLDPQAMPRHIAVIMDGNRRWAKERRLPVLLGHRAGVKTFRMIIETCRELGVKTLTAYAFSAENWRRSPPEIKLLMGLFEQYTRTEREKLVRTGVRFQPIGRYKNLPEPVLKEFEATAEATAHNQGMVLNLCVNYGGRDEIVEATRRIAAEVAAGRLAQEAITEELFSSYLFTGGQQDPDLLIRTSGEIRISNFLLWQVAYTEFYFTPAYWPDITRSHLIEAILEYQRRERRYGGGKGE